MSNDQQPKKGFFSFGKKPAETTVTETPQAVSVDEALSASREGLLGKIGHVFKSSIDLNDELFDELEELLITADIGVDASLALVEALKQRVSKEKIDTAEGVIKALQIEARLILETAQSDWQMESQPHVVLVVGVNGVGKTTTTAKMAYYFASHGKSVMMAAADTFRAAAVEQLQHWGEYLDIPVIAQGHGADAAAVAHDAIMSAQSKDIDVLLIDTAGRLHTQSDLMEQLEKVLRVIKKIIPDAPHEVVQVLDAGTGQNALSQLEHFQKATEVSSLCLTKLDGSARGGVALALTKKFGLPIRFIGVGEGIHDIRPFSAADFSEALIKTSDVSE